MKPLEDFLVLGSKIFLEIRLYESKLYEMLLSPFLYTHKLTNKYQHLQPIFFNLQNLCEFTNSNVFCIETMVLNVSFLPSNGGRNDIVHHPREPIMDIGVAEVIIDECLKDFWFTYKCWRRLEYGVVYLINMYLSQQIPLTQHKFSTLNTYQLN